MNKHAELILEGGCSSCVYWCNCVLRVLREDMWQFHVENEHYSVCQLLRKNRSNLGNFIVFLLCS